MKRPLTILTFIFLAVSNLGFWDQAIGQERSSRSNASGKKVFNPCEQAEEVFELPPLPPFFEDDELSETAPQPLQEQLARPLVEGAPVAQVSAGGGVDWENEPWLDPRVKSCVREYLDKWLILVNQEQQRKNEPPFTRIDDWGRLLRPPQITAEGGVERWNNPTQFVLEAYNGPKQKNSSLGGIKDYVNACVQREAGPPHPESGTQACSFGCQFKGMSQDRVGRATNPNPDGRPDAQFNLEIDCHGVERVVNYIKLERLSGPGGKPEPPYYDTSPRIRFWILGVYRYGRSLNPADIDIFDRVQGKATYETYASPGAPDTFPPDSWFRITVRFADKQEVSCEAQVRDSGAGEEQKRCDEYAKMAVVQNKENQKEPCGYSGIRWHNDYQKHYDWCLGLAKSYADSETKAREEQLRECIRCKQYAKTAVDQNRGNLSRQCGYSGIRWHNDYQKHYDWCLGLAKDYADSETTAREAQLRRCSAQAQDTLQKTPLHVRYSGMDQDRVGRASQSTPNGEKDTQFDLTLKTGMASRVVKSIVLESFPDRKQVWDTRPGGPWILGVYRDGRRLNPTDRNIRDPVRGTANYQIFANISGFQPGQRFRITVNYEDGRHIEAFAQMPDAQRQIMGGKTPRPSSQQAKREDQASPFDDAYQKFGQTRTSRSATRHAWLQGQIAADQAASYAQDEKGSETWLSDLMGDKPESPSIEKDDSQPANGDREKLPDESPAPPPVKDPVKEPEKEPPKTVTGIWNYHLKCKTRNNDVAVIKITLNESAGGAYEGGGTGKDYNGKNMQVRIKGTYNNQNYNLEGAITTTFEGGTCTRKDLFNTLLTSNDSGYIPLNQIQKCGCDGEVKLLKNN